MRRIITISLLTVAALVLTGCSLLRAPLQQLLPDPATSAGPLGIGSCLDGMNGADSDRTALVPCDELHLFEVTAIEEWPGMDDALAAADGDAGALWDEIHLLDGSEGATRDYGTWASRACSEAGQRMIGIADVDVDGHTASELWLFIGGPYGVDMSLGSREEFVAGDHRTVCSLAWYQGGQAPERNDDRSFAHLREPGVSLLHRECWDSEYYEVPCTRPHTSQVVVGFDGVEAYGPELVQRVASGGWTEADIDTTDAFCEKLLPEVVPYGAPIDGLGYYAETFVGSGWDSFDGTVDPEESYPFVCLVLGYEDGDLLSGDVYGDELTVEAGPPTGAGAGQA